MAANRPQIAVLITLDSKFEIAEAFCRHLTEAGGEPWVVDLSLRGHNHKLPEVVTTLPVDHDGVEFTGLRDVSRAEASQMMLDAAQNCVRDKMDTGALRGIVGIGGANGSTMACGVMRSLPPLLPKIMITPVAATAAV
ncbi:MAG: Tm-1-like ATP-binding domain-containing protein, partial [Methyloligellaceae bacterium]